MLRSVMTDSRAAFGFPLAASRAAWRVRGAWETAAGLTRGDFAEPEDVEEEREVWRRSESTEVVEVEVFVR
jgi:hypothetical protein